MTKAGWLLTGPIVALRTDLVKLVFPYQSIRPPPGGALPQGRSGGH